MRKCRIQSQVRALALMAVASGALMVAPAAHAQLNENCVVSVLNRNVQAKADGTWVLPNIPANFGSLRARATCVQGGVTTYGESQPFTLTPNGSVTLPPIVIGPTTPIPTVLRVSAPATTLAAVGASAQLQVLATYPNGGQQTDVTTNGTSYLVSNPQIATVTPGGLVTAVRSGTVVVQATNEGTSGLISIRVALAGADSDGDGLTDAEELQLGLNPNNPADALLDLDRDGLNAREEFQAGTDPRNADSDGDGLSDGDEVRCVRGGFCTNPLLADTDGDGLRDALEITTGSNPLDPASFNLAAALTGLRATPAAFTLVVNSLTGTASVQLTVIGTLLDGNEINLTSTSRQTTYSSSNLGSCNFGSPDGRVFASAAGTCNITISNNGRSVVVPGTVQDFAPSAVSFVAIPGYANGVAVGGDFAFVAAGSGGLQVVSLGIDRRTPQVVASLAVGGNANDITLAGNLAYLATSGGLKVVDVSTPTSPRLLGTFAGVGNILGVKVRGTTAFVTGGSTLSIISAANPGAMIQAGSVSVGGTAWNLELDATRNLALVAAGSAGLRIVDIANLSVPIVRGGVATGDARGVALAGNTAIVADYSNSMTSVNTTNTAAPVILSRTTVTLGGRLNGVALTGNFAVGADVNFVNGVPIVDITNPAALAPRTILNFPARDDNGMGIAVDNSFIYLAADLSGLNRGGTSGNSRLYIGQYQPRVDLAGVPPTAVVTAPAAGNLVYEGAPLTMTVDAVDDVAVASVQFVVNGQTAFVSTTAPYQYTLTVPTGVGTLQLGAIARDLGGNETAAQPVSVTVAPDPLTQVVGRVVSTAGQPVAGATVTAPGGRTGTTDAEGRFQIVGVPTVLGNLVVQASYTPASGLPASGSSGAVAPVLGGTTDMGTVTLIEAAWEPNFGTLWTTCDDCFTQRTLPFPFPFYGTSQTIGFIGSNGYITFGGGDSTYTESVSAFNSRARISAFFDDLIGGGGSWINDTLPDRFIVTYNAMRHYSFGGSFTLQIQLFRDGRIVMGYRGISNLGTGSITGLTPGPNAPFLQVNFSEQNLLDVGAQTAIYEYFTAASPFDLDGAFIVYTPKADGGYSVRTIMPPAAPQASTLTGQPGAGAPMSAVAQRRASAAQRGTAATASAPSPQALAHAEVTVRSSSNPRYVGMVNTDAQGRFTLAGVPAGGIDVEVRRDGRLIARGGGVFGGGALNQALLMQIELVSPEAPSKSGPSAGGTQ